jgi:YVTN family beta-propeller protein
MRFINLLFISVVLFSCKKDDMVPQVPSSNNDELKKGFLVLNEGLFQQNNSSLSWFDLTTETANNEFFEAKSGRLLGDTGNDMKRYGGKIYVVVNVSSTLEILDATTGKSLKQISMMAGAVAKQPRQIAFYGSKAYVTCFDGYVDVIDTVSLAVEKRIKVGLNPEGIEVSNNKLYVANSGGLNGPKMDSTVSVIDLASQTEIKKIVVGTNPGSVVKDDQGDIYVIAQGNYGSIPSRMVQIDTQNDEVLTTFPFNASGITKMGSQFLITYSNSSSSKAEVALFDTESETIITSSFLENSQITTLFGLSYVSTTNKIYCFDAMNYTNTGYVRQYSFQGNYEKSYHVGLNPNSILYYE